MQLVTNDVAKDGFTIKQTQGLIRKVTVAMVAVADKALRDVTLIRTQEIQQSDQTGRGNTLTAADARAPASSKAA